jgi:hypothetical protein
MSRRYASVFSTLVVMCWQKKRIVPPIMANLTSCSLAIMSILEDTRWDRNGGEEVRIRIRRGLIGRQINRSPSAKSAVQLARFVISPACRWASYVNSMPKRGRRHRRGLGGCLDSSCFPRVLSPSTLRINSLTSPTSLTSTQHQQRTFFNHLPQSSSSLKHRALLSDLL